MDSVGAAFFRKWYHRDDLIYYLEALNDHTIVETQTTGQWWLPERLTVAVEGLPNTQNRYYHNGFRVDDSFQSGSTYFVPNMQQNNLLINTHTGQLYFQTDTTASDYVQATYNFGQVGKGGPAAGTAAVVHVFHRTAMESADTYKHVSERRHQKGAGTLDGAFTLHDKTGNSYRQHVYGAYGERLITQEDQNGLIDSDPYYGTWYYKVQADGQLPMKSNKFARSLHYLLNFSGRSDAGSEYLYNYAEVYQLQNYTAALYMKRQDLTTGVMWQSDVVKHKDLCFRKNIIDQDGESFFPWIADGRHHALKWNVNYAHAFFPWMKLHLDASNGLLLFRPTQEQWSNSVYLQRPTEDYSAAPITELYRYDWESQGYCAGLLENTIGLDFHYSPATWVSLGGKIDLTLDGMLLQGKSKVSPNWQAEFSTDIHPCKWFEMGLTIGHYRMAYTADYLRYFSNQQLSGRIYKAGTDQLIANTGGAYHTYQKHLQQTSYFQLDIPIRFHWGKRGTHEIVLQNSYKKFFHVWETHYGETPLTYEVGYTERFGDNIIRNTPYYFSQLSRYTYTGKRVMVSVGWQSMQAAGPTGIGNGAMGNTMGYLSESTAWPASREVQTNPDGRYPGVSRYDLDKGFVLRTYLGYNICQYLEAGLTFKWTDGKPFTSYQYSIEGDRIAIRPLDSRGTNPTDNNFGTRHGAVFNFDLHLQGKWQVSSHSSNYPMSLKLECYNLWDFCHDLCEMAFTQDLSNATRSSMIMTVPTGLLLTYKIEIPQK